MKWLNDKCKVTVKNYKMRSILKVSRGCLRVSPPTPQLAPSPPNKWSFWHNRNSFPCGLGSLFIRGVASVTRLNIDPLPHPTFWSLDIFLCQLEILKENRNPIKKYHHKVFKNYTATAFELWRFCGTIQGTLFVQVTLPSTGAVSDFPGFLHFCEN